MNTNPNESPQLPQRPSPLGAAFSTFLPGLGQFLRGFPANGGWALSIGTLLVSLTWIIGYHSGLGTAIFFAMIFVLPWWCIQAYEASLPSPPGFISTLKLVWQQAHDIRFLGALFLLTAFTDLYIILANPEYKLTIFCTKPTGIESIIAKAQSPALHLIIGYGFLRLRRWSLLVYLAYAGFGLLNATANYACFGYGQIRTVFIITLLGFTAYVLLRHNRFHPKTTSEVANFQDNFDSSTISMLSQKASKAGWGLWKGKK